MASALKHLCPHARPSLMPALALALAAGAAGAASPAALRDPTLPPARLAASAAQSGAAEPSAPLRLQMIVRGPGEQRRALIAGRELRNVGVGDEFDAGNGPARVLRITDHGVLLARRVSGADGAVAQERLDLHPDLMTPGARRAAHPIPANRSGR